MSKEQIKTKQIYVTLDSLLDTRLGTLLTISEDFAFKVTSNPNYYTREIDIFEDEELGVLTPQNYTDVYLALREEIVRVSLKTKLIEFLKELSVEVISKAITTPFHTGVELAINVYPYHFSNEELENISKAITLQFAMQIPISIINISNSDLTCEYVKNNFSAMVMYDYGNWLNMHQRDIQTKVLKDVVLYAPRLNFVRTLTEDESKLFQDRNMDQFSFLTILMHEFITMQFLPIKYFCADTPLNI